MNVHLQSQRLAQEAFARVQAHQPLHKEYVSFAKKFPSLIHTCGLAQAVAFACARSEEQKGYAEDLAALLQKAGHPEIASAKDLDQQTREQPVSAYLRLSRNAIEAAAWLKRYVEAAAPDEPQEGS